MLTSLPPTRSQVRLSPLLSILNHAVNLWRRLTPESLPVSIRLNIGIHVQPTELGELVTPPSSAGPELAQVWWDKHRDTVLSPPPASRSKVGGHPCEGDRSSCWCRPPPLVLEVMTGPERSSLDVTYLTWHPDGGRGWRGHKKFSWHLQTSSSVTQRQQSRFHWTVSGSSYHGLVSCCSASYWADIGHRQQQWRLLFRQQLHQFIINGRSGRHFAMASLIHTLLPCTDAALDMRLFWFVALVRVISKCQR